MPPVGKQGFLEYEEVTWCPSILLVLRGRLGSE